MFETIQRFFVFIALLFGVGLGVALLVGPDSLRAPIEAEVPFLDAVAIGLILFFGLFLVALLGDVFAPRSRATFRAKSLLLALTAAGVGTGAGYLLLDGFGEVWLLWREGRPALATVVRYTPRRTAPVRSSRFSVPSRLIHEHEIRFDDRRAILELDRGFEAGATIPILYLRDRPEMVMRGEAGESFFVLLRRGPGLGFGAVLAVVLIGCLIAVPVQVGNVLAGPRHQDP